MLGRQLMVWLEGLGGRFEWVAGLAVETNGLAREASYRYRSVEMGIGEGGSDRIRSAMKLGWVAASGGGRRGERTAITRLFWIQPWITGFYESKTSDGSIGSGYQMSRNRVTGRDCRRIRAAVEHGVAASQQGTREKTEIKWFLLFLSCPPNHPHS
jgi:hypothetical protein